MAGKRSRTFVVGFLAGLALVAVGVVGASRMKQKDPDQQQQYRAELADASPVHRGQITENQRIHGRFYADYRQRMFGTISDLVAQAKEKSERIIGVELMVGMTVLVTERQSASAYFGRLA